MNIKKCIRNSVLRYLGLEDIEALVTHNQTRIIDMEQSYDELESRVDTLEGSREEKVAQVKSSNKDERYLLTEPDYFGPPAYLVKHEDKKWSVYLDAEQITSIFEDPKTALDDYINQCKEDDFLDDFMQGMDKGKCNFGNNKYALYVEKYFNLYMYGKELK